MLDIIRERISAGSQRPAKLPEGSCSGSTIFFIGRAFFLRDQEELILLPTGLGTWRQGNPWGR